MNNNLFVHTHSKEETTIFSQIKINTVCKWLEILTEEVSSHHVIQGISDYVQWHMLSHPLILYSVTIKVYTQSSPHKYFTQPSTDAVQQHTHTHHYMLSHNVAIDKGVHALAQRLQ